MQKIAAALILALGLSSAGFAAEPLYRLAATIALGAPDRWDYVVVDPASHRVYVAHGDEVTVVDGVSRKVIGQVTGFPGGTHGIGISTATGRGYSDDGKAGVAGAFDLASLRRLGAIPAAPDADSIAEDPDTGHIFVVDGDSGEVTAIDPAVGRAITNIKVGEGLEYAAADGRGSLYVNGAEKGRMIRINVATNQVVARWPLPGCEHPHGLAIDPSRRRLFVSCVNAVMVAMDADSGRIASTLPIGAGTDAAAFDPARHRIFSSNGRDGTISVINEIDAEHFAPLATIKTRLTGRTMGVDTTTGDLFVPAGEALPAKPHQRPRIKPGSLELLVLEPQ